MGGQSFGGRWRSDAPPEPFYGPGRSNQAVAQLELTAREHAPGGWPGAQGSIDWQPRPSEPGPLRITSAGAPAYRAKRAMDVVVASLLTLCLLPVFLVTFLAVRLSSPGPAIFRQARIGTGGRAFTLYKFRSMYHGNDDSQQRAYVASLIRGEARSDSEGVFKLTADRRVTPVGRFLRRYSVDELPQLWNVLTGRMSLVGPRPATPHEVDLYSERAKQRLLVKPGLTGLWQVSGRCRLSFDTMVDLDLEYVQTAGLSRDIVILARTLRAVVAAEGAA